MVISMNGPSFFSGDSVKNLVVMLHGRGASGDNMISLAPHMSKELPSAQFLAPHAHMNYGNGYTWFSDSVRDMEESTAFVEIMQAVQDVNEFIDAQLARFSIGDSELSLVGFSQGAMLAIYVGLCRAKKMRLHCGLLWGYTVPPCSGAQNPLETQCLCRPRN